MAKLPHDLEPIAEADMRRIASVIGPSSAAQAAINDLERMRADGMNPAIMYSRSHGCYVVTDIGNEYL